MWPPLSWCTYLRENVFDRFSANLFERIANLHPVKLYTMLNRVSSRWILLATAYLDFESLEDGKTENSALQQLPSTNGHKRIWRWSTKMAAVVYNTEISGNFLLYDVIAMGLYNGWTTTDEPCVNQWELRLERRQERDKPLVVNYSQLNNARSGEEYANRQRLRTEAAILAIRTHGWIINQLSWIGMVVATNVRTTLMTLYHMHCCYHAAILGIWYYNVSYS
jgi:hypothetical protein